MYDKIILFGELLEIDEASMNGIKLHVFMLNVGSQLRAKVKNAFNTVDTIYDFMQIGDSVVNDVYASLYKHGLCYLEKLGITEYDVEDIELFQGYLQTKYEDLDLLIIQNKIENEKALRERGISGEKKERERLKLEKRFFNKIQVEFMDACFMDAMKLVDSLDIFIQRSDIPIKIITASDEEKGVLLFEQLKKTGRNEKLAYKIAFQMFKANPTEREYYEYCMTQFPEELDNLVMLQSLVGLKFQKAILDKALKKMFENMPHNTEQQTLVIKNKMENIQRKLDISNNSSVKKVDKLLCEFDIEARTFEGILFSTRELRSRAEIDFRTISEYIGNIENKKEDECKKIQDWISDQNFVEEISKVFQDKINSRVEQIWSQEDSEEFREILISTNIYDMESISRSIKKIEKIGRTSEKERYIAALTGMKEENFRQVEKYGKWIELSFMSKYGVICILMISGVFLLTAGIGIVPLIIGIVLLVVKKISYMKGKKVWNLLTIDGETVNPQIELLKIKKNKKMNGKKCEIECDKNTLIEDNAECNNSEREEGYLEVNEIKKDEQEKEEYGEIEEEKTPLEDERLKQEDCKGETEDRSTREIGSENVDEAEQVKLENAQLESLKMKLQKVKKQKKRQELLRESVFEPKTVEVKKRYDLLKEKVNMEVPLSEKINCIYGLSIVIAFLLLVIVLMSTGEKFLVVIEILSTWSAIGIWIWPIWKIILIFISKRNSYYKNLKDV